MTDETAKMLADAMNRLSAALEGMSAGGLVRGINVYHHGQYYQTPQYLTVQPALYPGNVCVQNWGGHNAT